MKDKQQAFGKGLPEALAKGEANRIAEVQKRLAPKAKWTQSPPTEEGDYWWCATRESKPECAIVTVDDVNQEILADFYHDGGVIAEHVGGWWTPVLVPAPPGKEAKDV